MSCLTCHDPHVKVAPEARVEHYRAACAQCHGDDACGLDHAAERPPHLAGVSPNDCTACHMPVRRPEDVIHVVMTDHRITRELPSPDLLAPREERDPVIDDLVFHHPEDAPDGALGQAYRAVAALRSGAGGVEAVDALARSLEVADPSEVEPWMALARGQLDLGRFDAASRTLGRVMTRDGLDPGVRLLAREWLAVTRIGLGRTADGKEMLVRLLEEDPGRLPARFNLAAILHGEGDVDGAIEQLEAILAVRPNHLPSHRSLGAIHAAAGRPAEAAEAFRAALAWEPSDAAATAGLIAALEALGRPEEAKRLGESP